MDNLVSLCPSHHPFNHEFSAHKTPEAFKRWFKKNHPDRYRNVIKKAQTMITEVKLLNYPVGVSRMVNFAFEVAEKDSSPPQRAVLAWRMQE
jgi:hypothetical protein